jgi:hypothetical protein
MSAPQGSPEWRLQRCGHVTASEFQSLLAKGQGKMRAAYLRRVVCERLTGKPMETYATGSWAKNLERGKEQEPYARMSYESITGNLVEEVGFLKHSTIMAGCSPDGLIGEDGGVEIKSVIPTVQLETIESGGYPSEYTAQIQGSLWLTGRKWWDFCSYSQDMPENLRTYIFRVEPDPAYILALEASVRVFLSEVDAMVERLLKRVA